MKFLFNVGSRVIQFEFNAKKLIISLFAGLTAKGFVETVDEM